MTLRSLLFVALSLCFTDSAWASGCPLVDRFVFGFDRIGQMARLADGRVLIADHSTSIKVYSSSGMFLFQFGSSGSGLGQFDTATGVAVAPDGSIYVADQALDRITKFSSIFVPLFMFRQPTEYLIGATNLALSPDGETLYATELWGDVVTMFKADGSYIGSFGGTGSGPGQIDQPFGIAIDPTGTVYVAEGLNNRVQRFTGGGAPMGAWGSPGSALGQFNCPVGLGLDGAGRIYVTDQLNNRNQIFLLDGTPVCAFGSFGSGPNQFYNPWAILPIPNTAEIWIGDTFNHRFVIYDEKSVPAVQATWGSVKADYR